MRMQLVHDSFLLRPFLRLTLTLALAYQRSMLAANISFLGGMFVALLRGSFLGRLILREGSISKQFRRSRLCKWTNLCLNFPGFLLRRLYRATRPVCDNSLVIRFGLALMEDTPAAVSWLMLLFLILPYEMWNNAYSLLGFGLMLVFAVFSVLRRQSRRLDISTMGPYPLLFGLCILAAIPMSAYTDLSARFLYYHLAAGLCVLVLVSTVERTSQLRRLAGMATLSLLIISAYGVVQRIQGVDVNPSYVDLTIHEDMPGRVYAMYDNPNALGEVLVLLIPLAVGLFFATKRIRTRLFAAAAISLGIGVLIMTYSRAGWLGLAAAAFLFLLLWKPKLIGPILLLGLLILPVLPEAVLTRILSIFNMEDQSTSSRFPLYAAALRLVADRPIAGGGLGSDAVRQAVTDLNFYHGEAPFVHAHNVFLQVWAETGLWGLFCFVGAMLWLFKAGGKAALRKVGTHSTRLILIGSVSALFGILVCGIADYIWHYPRVMLIFWFLFAMAMASLRLAVREERRPEQAQPALHRPRGG